MYKLLIEDKRKTKGKDKMNLPMSINHDEHHRANENLGVQILRNFEESLS